MGPLWLYAPQGGPPRLDGRADAAEPVAGFSLETQVRTLALAPLPLRRRPGVLVGAGAAVMRLVRPDLPERPATGAEPGTDQEKAARALFQRAETVWDRLADVDVALADPINLWSELSRRWTEDAPDDAPRMDVIVRQARRLGPILDALDRAPRRILRRSHRLTPLARVQEMDRRAVTWLIRQPGDTLAERAGDRQRVLAVAREENFDTLENRVLRAYADLARAVAKDYGERHHGKRATRRWRDVDDFGRRCRRLSRDLAGRGVRLAEPGVTPNFTLLENPRYREVWAAWQALLRRREEEDEIWRWQARSWEEFCALAVMVALQRLPGARLVAAAPLTFLDEQRRGSRVEHDNPLGVFHLPAQDMVVEVQYRLANPGGWRADLAAPIWLRFGRTADTGGFLKLAVIWPIWDAAGGLVAGEAEEIAAMASALRPRLLRGAAVIRPAAPEATVTEAQAPGVIALATGVQGEALRDGVAALSDFFAVLFAAESG